MQHKPFPALLNYLREAHTMLKKKKSGQASGELILQVSHIGNESYMTSQDEVARHRQSLSRDSLFMLSINSG